MDCTLAGARMCRHFLISVQTSSVWVLHTLWLLVGRCAAIRTVTFIWRFALILLHTLRSRIIFTNYNFRRAYASWIQMTVFDWHRLAIYCDRFLLCVYRKLRCAKNGIDNRTSDYNYKWSSRIGKLNRAFSVHKWNESKLSAAHSNWTVWREIRKMICHITMTSRLHSSLLYYF